MNRNLEPTKTPKELRAEILCSGGRKMLVKSMIISMLKRKYSPTRTDVELLPGNAGLAALIIVEPSFL